MIPVKRVRKPSGYDTKVKTPGDAWLKDHPGAQRPPALWSPYTAKLADGFDHRCGYAAMHDPTGGTVDHFLSYKNHPHLTYEWSNFRFASATLNSSKKTADDTVLDPHEVGEGWFEILLPSLQMRLTDKVPPAQRAKAEFTLDRLKLRDGERILRWRQSWFALYEQGQLTLDGLRQMAPLIAAAVEARDRI
jgi:5-methylcytosine-specific restriction endonuclease McrA